MRSLVCYERATSEQYVFSLRALGLFSDGATDARLWKSISKEECADVTSLMEFSDGEAALNDTVLVLLSGCVCVSACGCNEILTRKTRLV